MTKVFSNGDEATTYYAPRFIGLPVEQLASMAAALWCLYHGEPTEDGRYKITETD